MQYMVGPGPAMGPPHFGPMSLPPMAHPMEFQAYTMQAMPLGVPLPRTENAMGPTSPQQGDPRQMNNQEQRPQPVAPPMQEATLISFD